MSALGESEWFPGFIISNIALFGRSAYRGAAGTGPATAVVNNIAECAGAGDIADVASS
jgi:hypothetical protein